MSFFYFCNNLIFVPVVFSWTVFALYIYLSNILFGRRFEAIHTGYYKTKNILFTDSNESYVPVFKVNNKKHLISLDNVKISNRVMYNDYLNICIPERGVFLHSLVILKYTALLLACVYFILFSVNQMPSYLSISWLATFFFILPSIYILRIKKKSYLSDVEFFTLSKDVYKHPKEYKNLKVRVFGLIVLFILSLFSVREIYQTQSSGVVKKATVTKIASAVNNRNFDPDNNSIMYMIENSPFWVEVSYQEDKGRTRKFIEKYKFIYPSYRVGEKVDLHISDQGDLFAVVDILNSLITSIFFITLTIFFSLANLHDYLVWRKINLKGMSE